MEYAGFLALTPVGEGQGGGYHRARMKTGAVVVPELFIELGPRI